MHVGTLPPVISIFSTTTSVTIFWTQPEFSVPVLDYEISLMGQVLCPSVMDNQPQVTTMTAVTSMEFTGIQEFSTYTVTVTARFSAFGLLTHTSTSMDFTTLGAGME